jgi:hypothetical protein
MSRWCGHILIQVFLLSNCKSKHEWLGESDQHHGSLHVASHTHHNMGSWISNVAFNKENKAKQRITTDVNNRRTKTNSDNVLNISDKYSA